jgi:hypothetical protein
MHPIGTVVLIKATITEQYPDDETGLIYGVKYPASGDVSIGDGDIFAVVSEPVIEEPAPEPSNCKCSFPPEPKFKVRDRVTHTVNEFMGEGTVIGMGDDKLHPYMVKFDKIGPTILCAEERLILVSTPEIPFHVGDLVIHDNRHWGLGDVVEIRPLSEYPIVVKFADGFSAKTECTVGKLHKVTIN